MSIDWLKAAQDEYQMAKRIREWIHAHPELGNHEFETKKLIVEKLKSFDLDVIEVLDTAVIGVLKGDLPGSTVVLRGDMDALSMAENTGCDFSSVYEGKMHGCGHDMHTTAVLMTAKLLAKHRDMIHGTILFVFQPDEEGNGGAQRIIDTGVLNGCQAVFGAHMDPNLPDNTIGIRYGKFYAASVLFDVTVHGISAHSAHPELGKDALGCGCQMVRELLKLPEQFEDKTVLTVGQLNSGTASNVLSDTTVFRGVIRALGNENCRKLCELFEQCCLKVAQQWGCGVDVDFHGAYSGIENEDDKSAFVEKAARELIGDDRVVVMKEPLMITEDFGYYIETYGGCFYHVSPNCHMPLHSNSFLPESEVLVTMIALHCKILTDYLSM